MPKPLYLDGARSLLVALDGPALRIGAEGTADRRVPLQRVSRVVVWGDVSWNTDALLACADAGIAVCFLRNGLARARLLGRTSAIDSFASLWSDFLDRPDWRDRYAGWHDNLRSRSIRFCALRLGLRPSVLASAPERLLRQCLAGRGRTRSFLRTLNGIAHARATEELTNMGLDAGNTESLRIVPSLVMALQWGLLPEFRRLRPSDRLRTDPVAFFERRGAAVDYHLAEAIHLLRRHLEGLV